MTRINNPAICKLSPIDHHHIQRILLTIFESVPDEILSFLTRLTQGNKQTTKRNRYSSLKAFFRYIRNTIDAEIYLAFSKSVF